MIVYISGPYSNNSKTGSVMTNIRNAEGLAKYLWGKGYVCICPHTNTGNFENVASYDAFMVGYLEILKKCDVIIMIKGWEVSSGATREHQQALEDGQPIAYTVESLDWIRDNFEEAKKKAEAFKLRTV